MKRVYFIGILDFVYDETTVEPIVIREVTLKDQYGKEFYDKLRLIYLQMPVFTLQENELKTHQDKWLYFLKHLPGFDFIPQILNEPIFQQAFHTAEIAAMTPEEQAVYDQSQNDYWSYLATIETAEKKGRDEGKAEVAGNLKRKGMSVSDIADVTGLTVGEIERLS